MIWRWVKSAVLHASIVLHAINMHWGLDMAEEDISEFISMNLPFNKSSVQI